MLRAAIFTLIPIAITGCGASGSGVPPVQDAALFQRHAKAAPLCIKLTDGDPNPKTPRECSGRTYHAGVNTDICFPTHANPCVSVPETATVQASENGYKGKIFAAMSSKKLPKAVLNNPNYPGALCDDEGTANYSEDVLDVHPRSGTGPTRSFTIRDYGPRSGANSASSDCDIIFYDKSNNVMSFSIVMLTVPG
ncbi:MAG: hypothetical protein JO302_02265 [Candidatus Eremiobacteraeota bacterium]|nr:hypothetical protein [Candidatus Eremiobacteraeota bacterium]